MIYYICNHAAFKIKLLAKQTEEQLLNCKSKFSATLIFFNQRSSVWSQRLFRHFLNEHIYPKMPSKNVFYDSKLLKMSQINQKSKISRPGRLPNRIESCVVMTSEVNYSHMTPCIKIREIISILLSLSMYVVSSAFLSFVKKRVTKST